MSTETLSFEDACTAAKAEDQAVAAIKQTFVEPLRELKKLRAGWETTRAELQTRLTRAQGRLQQAVNAGVDLNAAMRLTGPLVNDLQGGGPMPIGLLSSIGPQIERGMADMERFDEKQLPLRQLWLSWPNIPSRVRDNINAAEARMAQLESLVADGGPLQQMIERVAERKAGSQAVA